MDLNHQSEFLTLSGLMTVLAGSVVMASLLLAQASEITEAVLSSDFFDATVADTVRHLGSLLPE